MKMKTLDVQLRLLLLLAFSKDVTMKDFSLELANQWEKWKMPRTFAHQ